MRDCLILQSFSCENSNDAAWDSVSARIKSLGREGAASRWPVVPESRGLLGWNGKKRSVALGCVGWQQSECLATGEGFQRAERTPFSATGDKTAKESAMSVFAPSSAPIAVETLGARTFDARNRECRPRTDLRWPA